MNVGRQQCLKLKWMGGQGEYAKKKERFLGFVRRRELRLGLLSLAIHTIRLLFYLEVTGPRAEILHLKGGREKFDGYSIRIA